MTVPQELQAQLIDKLSSLVYAEMINSYYLTEEELSRLTDDELRKHHSDHLAKEEAAHYGTNPSLITCWLETEVAFCDEAKRRITNEWFTR